MKHKKSALFNSLISLLLCLSMLVGTTFAWFTDYVVTGINTIAAGVLDVELYHSNATVTDEQVTSATKLFMDLQGKPILWEPGVVSYENLRITNAGDLALMYQLAINTANENFVVDPSGEQYGLSQILEVGVVEGGITATDRAGVVASVKDGDWTTLGDFLRDGSLLPEGAGESEDVWGIVVYWEPGENDNFWNLNNGKTLNEGDILSIDLGISLVATQEQFESDSFGDDYDTSAKSDVFPDFVGGSASTNVTPNGQNQVASEVKMTSGLVAATVPAGVQLAEGTTELTLSVSNMSASGSNIILGENEAMRSLDVHIEGVAENNTVPMTIKLAEAAPTGLNMGNYKLFHVENGNTVEMTLVESGATFTAHNQFKYDPATGDLTLYMATFSEVSVVADTTKAWEGGVDHNWYVGKSSPYTIANADQLWSFSQIVGGMNGQTQHSFVGETVKLISDINLDDKESENKSNLIFYPIGYYNSEGTYKKTDNAITSGLRNFEGTFDGQGHTISNFYQNTWEMKGDHNWYDATLQYYRDGMGLFGKVYGGTVKNLTVSNFSSDGEIATTGVIAAYADGATFENIAIVNCNPRVYNIGNGGIVGCVGWYAKEAGLKTTFKNVTVDNSNKISALWGSYDVACGGIVGQYYPTSGQSSANNPVNAGIHFENCHVAAQMDVYNDVCGNYQYYAYRYAGMMIGSIRENTTNEDGKTIPDMTGISATGCTVNYGDWNDYYYCEFEKNSLASYSEDYQFSRVPHSELNFTDSNGNGVVDADERASVIGCKHTHTAEEDKQAVYLPFHQLFTGYGWGVSSIGLEKYSGIVTNLDITEGNQEESVEKFAAKYDSDPETEGVQTPFLYRVGNLNTVKAGTLFEALEGAKILDSGVIVSVTSMYNELEVMGSFKPNTTDWTQGEITFEKIGPVKVTIQDYQYCKPTVLYLEVVKANNVTAISAENNTLTGWKSGGSNVLLENVSISENGTLYLNGGTLFGNGFELDAQNAAYSGVEIDANSYVILVKDAEIDNVTIKGKVYPEVGGTKENDYYRPLLFITGTEKCTITNSTLSGTASPIRTGCDLELINVVLDGGVYANLDMRGGNLILDNVTTINQESDTDLFGLGVVVYQEGGSDDMSITIRNALNQYNFISESHYNSLSGYAKTLVEKMFEATYARFQFTDANGVRWVNTGIISMNNLFNGESDIIDQRTAGHGYSGLEQEITVAGQTRNCYVYTLKPNADDLNEVPSAGTESQDVIAPDVEYKHSVNNVTATEEQPNDFCSANDGVVTISMDVGDAAFNWNPVIMEATKSGKTLGYTATVTVDASEYVFTVAADGSATATKAGMAYTAATIPFGTAGEYTVTYSYTDPYNFGVDSEGNMIRFDKDYTSTLTIRVITVAPAAKHAEFSFGANGTAYDSKTVTVTSADGTTKTYVMPNVTATVDAKIGSTTVNGTTVYYPITEMYTSDGKTEHTGRWYACFPIFKDAVQIVDYADEGTGDAVIYNQTTVKTVGGIPSTLKATNPTSAFLYSMNATNYPPPTDPTEEGGVVCYTCNRNGLDSGNTREEMTIIAEYMYTDNVGTPYYYYVGYHCAKQTEGGCFTEGTLITLADGTQKAVEDLNVGDMVLAFNHVSGQFEAAPIIFNTHTDEAEAREHDVLHLEFANGSEVEIVESHGLFDMTLMQYVYVDYTNYQDYIGHEFYFAGEKGDAAEAVTLENAYIVKETVRIFCPVSYFHMNSIANGFLNTPNIPGDITGLVNYFEYDPDLKYNEAAMQRDIEKYGLYTYADFSDYISEAAYNSSPAVYLKVAVGKGMITFEEILGVIEYLLAGSLIE